MRKLRWITAAAIGGAALSAWRPFAPTVPLESYYQTAHAAHSPDAEASLSHRRGDSAGAHATDAAAEAGLRFTTDISHGFCACYAPGTPETYMRQFEAVMARSRANAYSTANRWTQTATDGFASTNGTPITLTYSFPPDTNTGDPETSNVLHATLDAQFGTRDAWKALFADVFDAWGELVGIQWVEVADDGAEWPDAGGQLGVRGDVRIVALAVDGPFNVLAYNYFPNTGDMALDSAEDWADAADNFRFFRNVIMHEMGHGIGLNHVNPRDGTKLMEAFLNTDFEGPQDDDVRGANFLYGDAREPNATAGAASSLGSIAATAAFNELSLHNSGDVDWYRVTVLGQQPMSAIAAPIGSTYPVGPDPGGTSSVNTLAINPLRVEVYDSSGGSLLADATAAAAGQPATSPPVEPSSASEQFLIRVLSGGSANASQRYVLTLALGAENTLNVQSSPISGIAISVSPADANGAGGGTTSFSRNYATGTTVTLTVPGASGVFAFQRWVVNGVEQPLSQTAVLVVMPQAGATAVAHYEDPSELTAYAGADAQIVAGEPVQLAGAALGGVGPYAYAWAPAASLSSDDIAQPFASPATSTTYTLVVSDSQGRVAQDSVTVTVVAPLAASAGNDQQVIAGDAFVLSGSASGGSLPYSYSWSPAAALENPTKASAFGSIHEETEFTLTVTDNAGRTAQDTVRVAVAEPVVVEAGPDVTIAKREFAGLTAAAAGGVPPYRFSWTPIPSSDDDEGGAVARPDATTDYTVTVTDALGQTDSDSVRVTVVDALTVSAGGDVEIEAGDEVRLDGEASGGVPPYVYRWSPADGLSDANVAEPAASPDSTRIYTLTVTDADGRDASDSVSIAVTTAGKAPTSTADPGNGEIAGPQPNPCGVGVLTVLPLILASMIPMRRRR